MESSGLLPELWRRSGDGVVLRVSGKCGPRKEAAGDRTVQEEVDGGQSEVVFQVGAGVQ